jgi:DnaJ-class molecular chaperone
MNTEDDMEPCGKCNGSGVCPVCDGDEDALTDCDECGGSGRCVECEGSGEEPS